MSKQSSSFPEEDRDTGKPLSTKGKKVLEIDFRYKSNSPKWCRPKSWTRWRKYKTEKSRDEALKVLTKKAWGWIEYRKGKST